MRETEVTARELRDAVKQSAWEALRRLIQAKLRHGLLPRDEISGRIPGYAGDGSPCGACAQHVGPDQLMMVIPSDVPIPLHADCFEIWNNERRAFRGGA